MSELTNLMLAIGADDPHTALGLLDAAPHLATATIARDEEFLLADRLAQVYEGDTALHAAAFSYDAEIARELVGRGADVRARNRRGAEPLHAAVMGGPGSTTWDPPRQRAVIVYLVESGAGLDARAAGGVTPLHRAVRNRCSAAVEVLLSLGADARARNDNGSTATDLAGWTTGRGGTGSAEAKAEQELIVDLLAHSTA